MIDISHHLQHKWWCHIFFMIMTYDLSIFFEYIRVLTPLFCVSLFCLGSLLLVNNKTSILIGGKELATRLFILIVNFPRKWPWTGWSVIAMEPNMKDLWFFLLLLYRQSFEIGLPITRRRKNKNNNNINKKR